MDCSLPRLLSPWDFPGKNTGVGCHFLLQGIFPTQGSNPGLPHCRQMLYRLSYQGSPTWVKCMVCSALSSLRQRTPRNDFWQGQQGFWKALFVSVSLDNHPSRFFIWIGGGVDCLVQLQGNQHVTQEQSPTLANVIGLGWAHDPHQPITTFSKTTLGPLVWRWGVSYSCWGYLCPHKGEAAYEWSLG